MKGFPILVFLIQLNTLFGGSSQSSNSSIHTSCLVKNAVHALSGHLVLHHVDAISPGFEPIPIERSYVSEHELSTDGGWALFSHTRFKIEMGPDHFKGRKANNQVIHIQEPNGQTIRYTLVDSKGAKIFTPDLTTTFDPRFQREISGRTDPKNNVIKIAERTKHDSTATLTFGDGGRRIYKKKPGDEQFYLLKEEHKPNGNIVLFDYFKDERLRSIVTCNRSRTKTYSAVRFSYNSREKNKNRDFAIKMNDGREIYYKFMRPTSEYEWIHKCFYLEQVGGHRVVSWKYQYDLGYPEGGKKKHKRIFDQARGALINEIQSGGESILKLSYYSPRENHVPNFGTFKIEKASDLPCKLVKEISEPINDKYSSTFGFNFSHKSNLTGGVTKVKDALGNETEYTFKNFGALSQIVFYGPEKKLIRTEKFIWSGKDFTIPSLQDRSWTGNDLELHLVLDPEGTGSFAHKYKYDTRGNIREDTLYGNLTGLCEVALDPDQLDNGIESFRTTYEYTEDGFNLLRKKVEENGLTTIYEYEDGTDLLKAEYLCKNSELLVRTFYLYQDAFLIEKIVDDGTAMDSKDKSFKTLRTITRITPNGDYYPEKIEEFGVDLETGSEISISSKGFEYFPKPKHHLVKTETLYDAKGTKSYSIERTYDEADHVKSEKIDPLGAVTTWKYNSRHYLEERQKADGPKETFKYYSGGPLKSETADDHVTSYTYDELQHRKTTIDPNDTLTKYQLDRLGNPTQISIEKSDIKSEYDFMGRLTKRTDPKKYETKTKYNARGQPIQIEHPTGVEIFTYTLKGNLKNHTDLDGTKTVYEEYDPFDRWTSKKIYSSNKKLVAQESKVYSPFLLQSETDAEKYTTTYKYDHAGRKILETRSDRSIEYSYDLMGYLHTITQGDLKQITERDPWGRVKTGEKRDLIGNLLEKKEYEYNRRGLVDKEIYRFGDEKRAFQTKYDPFGRVVETIDPLGNKTTLSYSLKPNLKTITDPLGRKKIETYNKQGKLASSERKDRLDQTIGLENYEYDLNGNLEKQKSSIYFQHKIVKTVETQWRYGAGNQKVEWTEAFGTPIQRKTFYEYTPKGLLKKITKPNGTNLTYDYDPLGYQEVLKSSDSSIHYSYRHNCLGDLLSISDLNTGQTTTRKIDPFGQILKEDMANGYTMLNTYDDLGQRRTLTLPDQTIIEYKYSGTQLSEIVRLDSDRNTIYSHKLQKYDLSGNVLLEQLPFESGEIRYGLDPVGRYNELRAPPFTETINEFDSIGKIIDMTTQGILKHFEYDDLDQLILENGETFVYDSHYNRLLHNGEEIEVDELHQLKKTTQLFCTYDSLGNLKTKTTREGTFSYGYDPLDRLIYIKNPDGIETTYTYDPLHRRLTKTTDGKRTRFLYDGQKEIGFEKEGLLSLRILASSPYAEIGAAVALELGEKIYIPINDLQGNIAILYDPITKSSLEENRYSAFGVEANPSEINPWRYLSKHHDAESGLIYFGRRYYDPSQGRWITTDPKGYTDSMNLYAFTLNNPFLLVDLYGLSSIESALPQVTYSGFHENLWTEVKPFTKGSGAYDLGLPEKSDRHRILFVNGVGNDFESAKENAAYISKLAGGYNVHFVHNATFGVGPDLIECMMGLRDIATEPTMYIGNKIKEFAAVCSAEATFLVIGHSQGNILGRNHLLMSPKSVQSLIHVVAIAPGAYILPETCASVVHYRAASGWRDFIPRIDKEGAARAVGTIVDLPWSSLNPLPLSLHSFQHPIYRGSLTREIKNYYKSGSK